MKKILAALLSAAMMVSVAGCGSSGGNSSSSSENGGASASSSAESSSSEAANSAAEASSSAQTAPAENLSPVLVPESITADPAEIRAAYEGTGNYANEPTAEIVTSMGTVKIRLFPDLAPKTVENFITHAKAGYYNGLIFHRVINDFMIQGGDPQGNGTGGESIWNEPFEDEFTPVLHNFRGALSMANSGPNTNGSQFFIVQNKTPIVGEAEQTKALMNMYAGQLYRAGLVEISKARENLDSGKMTPEQYDAFAVAAESWYQSEAAKGIPENYLMDLKGALDIYAEVGGTPHLDFQHTVFGYVYEGMDVIDKIAAVQTTADKPVEDVTITSITIHEAQ